jgi:hypothetical protein
VFGTSTMTPKRLVTIIATLIVACSIAVIVSYILTVGPHKLAVQSVRFALTCLLCVSLVRGWNPGRWITAVLIGLAGLGSLLGGLGLIARSLNGIWLMAVGLLYVLCVAGLFSPLAARHFRAEPGASPNGGPATRSGTSEVTEGPPSVS